MRKGFLMILLLGGLGALVYSQKPELQRYLKMKRM
jgi:hypothetical protein